jgi:hypothetical protein
VPPDADGRVDDRVRGKGQYTETFTFTSDTDFHRVSVEREGYRRQDVTISPDDPREVLTVELKPVARRVTFTVTPMPAIVRLNGKPLNAVPAAQVETEVAFEVDDFGRWGAMRVTAEREGFDPYTREIKYEDKQSVYVLDLQAKRKDFTISTSPDKAEVFINGEPRGTSPVRMDGYEFPVDPRTGRHVPHKIRVEKPGYAPLETEISWDDGRQNYEWALEPLTKTVRIVTEPRDARVFIGRGEGVVEVPLDESGAHTRELVFGPPNERGQLPAYNCRVTREKTADQEWKDHSFILGWDAGRTNYEIKLQEILTRQVPLLRMRLSPREDGSWAVAGERVMTVGMKDTDEGAEGAKPAKITQLPKETFVDSLAVSPDGTQLAFTVLFEDAGRLVSRIVTQQTDGSADTRDLTDGTSLEVTPSFTPDGSRIVFASNRGGRNLSIWSMPATDEPVPERLTILGSHELWPTVDSNPKPRLFYETYIDTRPGPRLYSTPVGVTMPRDLAPAGGTQPRVAPTADAVLFAARDPKTGKRDLFRMTDEGRDVTNLTNTPDVDEFDATWSGDGLRVAYVSDQGATSEAPNNTDLWVLDPAGGSQPVRVTANLSQDDCPAWDQNGRALYFRSNRGGQWNVWRIDVK